MRPKEVLEYVLSNEGISYSDLAKLMGIPRAQSLYDIRDGKIKNISENYANKILAAFPKYNKGWLMSGEGEILKDALQKNAVQDMTNKSATDTLSDYETWLLPQTAHGGSLTSIPADGALLQNCEKIISPIKGVDFAITVYGDSMAPEYPSGSRVLIKRINPNAYIDWGKAYVLDTCNGVILKEVLKCEREGYVTCHSINPDPKYANFDVLMSDIYGMYRVLMCLSAK